MNLLSIVKKQITRVIAYIVLAKNIIRYLVRNSPKIFCTKPSKYRDHLHNLVHTYFVLNAVLLDSSVDNSIDGLVFKIERFGRGFRSKLAVNFLLSTFKYAIDQRNKSTDLLPNGDRNLYLLHLCIWGQNYSDKFLNYLAPSLLAPGNIPCISDKYSIHFLIHCDQHTKEKLEGSKVVHELSNFATIHFIVVPQTIFTNLRLAEEDKLSKLISKISTTYPYWKYYLLGCLQNLAMLTAQENKARITFLMPDLLFSENSLSTLFNEMSNGKKAAVASAFRSLDEKVHELVKPFYRNNALCLPGKELVNIAASSMHSAAQNRIVSSRNQRFQLTAQMIFHYPNELIIRALHYHPLLVDFNMINKKVNFDINPIDTNLLCNIVQPNLDLHTQIWVSEDPTKFGFLEISKNDIEPKRPKKKIDVVKSISDSVNAPSWGTLNRYLLSKRCKYRYCGNHNYILSDVDDFRLLYKASQTD